MQKSSGKKTPYPSTQKAGDSARVTGCPGVHCVMNLRTESVLGGLVFISPSAAPQHKNNAKILTKAEKDRENYCAAWYKEYLSER